MKYNQNKEFHDTQYGHLSWHLGRIGGILKEFSNVKLNSLQDLWEFAFLAKEVVKITGEWEQIMEDFESFFKECSIIELSQDALELLKLFSALPSAPRVQLLASARGRLLRVKKTQARAAIRAKNTTKLEQIKNQVRELLPKEYEVWKEELGL